MAGQGGGGVAGQGACLVPLQGRQEGQTGLLVSVLAPSGKKGLGDCETVTGSPLPPGLLSHTHAINLRPEVARCQASGQREPGSGVGTGFSVR